MSDPTPAPDQPAPDDPALRLAELAGEVARLKDTLLRSHADQQNQQRRHQRERDDLRKFAVAGLLEDLLPALDSLTLGLESATKQPEAKAVADGFRMAVNQLRATLAGRLISVHARAGAAVRKGDTLLVLESMKMEHAMVAPFDGTVQEVSCAKGEQVMPGKVLVQLLPSEQPPTP